MRHRLILSMLLVAAAVSAAPKGDVWPQWRGPERDGQFHGAPWPDNLDSLERRWRVEVGPGYSGPIVSRDKVFTVETRDKQTEIVRAFDRATGKQLWEAQWAGSMKVPWYARANGSWTRSTPALDEGRLYVGGMLDVLVCLDEGTGEVIWRADLAKRHGRPIPQFGFVCSPLVAGGALYVQAADGLLKIDKASGKTLWRVFVETDKDKSHSAYSSPIVAELQGRQQIVAQSRETLAGFDPGDGSQLWDIPVRSSHDQNILTPVSYQGGVLISSYGGRSQLLRIIQRGDALEAEPAWDNKLQGYMSSPVVVDGHGYLHLRNNRFACMDLKNGDINWTTKEKFTDYASLVANDDKILMLDSEGGLHLIAADPTTFRILDQRDLSEQETWAHLAVVEEGLFIRELNALTCFGWK